MSGTVIFILNKIFKKELSRAAPVSQVLIPMESTPSVFYDKHVHSEEDERHMEETRYLIQYYRTHRLVNARHCDCKKCNPVR